MVKSHMPLRNPIPYPKWKAPNIIGMIGRNLILFGFKHAEQDIRKTTAKYIANKPKNRINEALLKREAIPKTDNKLTNNPGTK